MVLKDILSVSGQPGLFKFVAQGKNAIVIEHLETKKRSTAYSSDKVSALEEISMFTTDEDMPLGKVFDLIFEKENGGPAIDPKSDPEKLKNYFAEVLPQFDRDRVYTSDIKKLFQWYNFLQKLNLLVKNEPEIKEETESKEDTVAEESKAVPAKKAPAAKKKSSKSKSE